MSQGCDSRVIVMYLLDMIQWKPRGYHVTVWCLLHVRSKSRPTLSVWSSSGNCTDHVLCTVLLCGHGLRCSTHWSVLYDLSNNSNRKYRSNYFLAAVYATYIQKTKSSIVWFSSVGLYCVELFRCFCVVLIFAVLVASWPFCTNKIEIGSFI